MTAYFQGRPPAALTPAVLAADDSASAVETGGATSNNKRFYKVARTAFATFDAITGGFTIN